MSLNAQSLNPLARLTMRMQPMAARGAVAAAW
jgi:hypothetical protein